MNIVEDKARKSIWKKSFEKYVVVVNKKDGDAFFDEVFFLLLLSFVDASLSVLLSDMLLTIASFFELDQLLLFYECHLQYDH